MAAKKTNLKGKGKGLADFLCKSPWVIQNVVNFKFVVWRKICRFGIVSNLFIMSSIFRLLSCLIIYFLSLPTEAQIWKYSEVLNPKTDPDLIALEKGQEPQVIRFNSFSEFEENIQFLAQRGYVMVGLYLGHPSFKESKNKSRALKAGIKAGATMILTDSFLESHYYALSKNQLTLIQKNLQTPPTSSQVSVQNNIGTTPKPKLGIQYRDLTIEERQENERNSGVYVVDVIRDMPAYESNIIPGDVIIAINSLQIKNMSQAQPLFEAIDTENDVKIRLIRNGEEREIVVKFN